MMLLRKLALVATFLATAAVASPNPLAAPPGVPLPPGVSVPGGAGGDPNAWIQALPLRAENGTNIRHACQHIHKALHKRQFFGPFHAASDGAYFNSTYKYYDARQAGNRPRCVIFPEMAKDLTKLFQLFRRYDVNYAVRGGGHSTGFSYSDLSGFSSTTGVLVDMSKMRAVSFDKATGIARWETGHNWKSLAIAMEPYNRQVAGGRVGSVGAGVVLGGGLSYFGGQSGFASDLVVAYEVVLSDGSVVTADANNRYKDLFWALKAGRQNAVGIVYAIHSRTIGGKNYYHGTYMFNTSDVPELLGTALVKWWGSGADACPGGHVLPSLIAPFSGEDAARLNVFTFFHDGAKVPEGCFADFFKFTPVQKQEGTVSYSSLMSDGLLNTDTLQTGFANAMHSVPLEIPNKDTILAMYKAWDASVKATSGQYIQRSLSFSVVTSKMLDFHRAAGGSPMGLQHGSNDGFLYLEVGTQSLGPELPTDQALFESDMEVSRTVPVSGTRQLPYYANYARRETRPLLTWNPKSLRRYRNIVAKYDRDGFALAHTHGHHLH